IRNSTNSFETEKPIKTPRRSTISRLLVKFSSIRITREEPEPPQKLNKQKESTNGIATKLSITTSNPTKYLVDYIDTRDPRTQFGPLTKIGSGSTGDVY